MDLNDALETTAKGIVFLFIGLVLSKAFTYGYRLVVARTGTGSYGIISLAIVVVGLLGTISMLGTNIGVHRYVAFYRARNQLDRVKGALFSAVNLTLALSVPFSILLFVLAPWISINLFGSQQLISVLKIVSVSVPFFSLSVLFMFSLQAFKQSKYSAYGKYLAEGFLKFIIAAVLIYLGYALLGAIVAYVLSLIFSTILLLFFIKKTFPEISKIKAKYNYKELVGFSWPLVFTTLFWILMTHFDTLMIGVYRPLSDVGIYNAAAPTSYLLLTLPIALRFIFLPIITTFYSKREHAYIEKIAKSVFKWNIVFLVPMFFILVLFSKEVLGFLFGAAYVPAAASLVILSIGYFIHGLTLLHTEFLKLIKKTKLIAVITTISLALNILLNVILIQKYGILGAAMATTFVFILYSVLTTLFSYHFMKFNPIKSKSALIFVLGFVSFLATRLLISFEKHISFDAPGYVLSFLHILFFLAVFWALLYIAKCFDKEDLLFITLLEKKAGLKLKFLRKFFVRS